MLVTVLLSMASSLLLFFGIAGAWALFVSRNNGSQTTPEVATSGYLAEIEARLTGVELMVKSLPSLWEEERERALKHANRAYQSEKRARELLSGDEDETEDEEDQRLLDLDAFRSESEGLHAMPGGMVSPVDPDLQARANAALGYV